jgi:hypothetical protein
MEGAMAAFGIYSLVSGLREGTELQIFWGVMILTGLGLLMLVRRRDWKKHWEEMEAAHARRATPPPSSHPDTTREEK